jgi:endonuclease III-like uncharacterized protein
LTADHFSGYNDKYPTRFFNRVLFISNIETQIANEFEDGIEENKQRNWILKLTPILLWLFKE